MKKYIITFSIASVITFIILLTKDIFNQTEKVEIMRILVDSFFVTGVLFTCFGILIVASNEGTFDMLVYGAQKIFDVFRRDVTKIKHKTFYDYRMAKLENKKSFLYMIVIGVLFIIISLIFLMGFYNAK